LARQVTLVNGFERDAAALFQRFRDKQRPYDEAIAALWSPLQKALQDKYVLFEADKLDTMVLRSRRSPWQPQAMLAEGSFDFVRFVESVEGVRRREREQQEAARRRAAERERAERAAAEEDQLLERRAKEAVLPIMSNLSLEQAKRALARNGKDPQRTLDWLLSVDPQSLARALDEAPKSEARPVAQAPANYVSERESWGAHERLRCTLTARLRAGSRGGSQRESPRRDDAAGVVGRGQDRGAARAQRV
jgi:hypothetical protein